MAGQLVADTFQFTATAAFNGAAGSVIVLTPVIPAGASIGQVWADVYSSSTQALGQAATTFTNVVAGNPVTVTQENLTGVCTAVTKATVTTLSWNTGSESTAPTVSITLSGAITTNYAAFVHYLVSYN